MRNLTRATGSLFATAALAVMAAPRAGAATTAGVLPATAAFSSVTNQTDYFGPCLERGYRLDHPGQCGVNDYQDNGYYGSGYYDGFDDDSYYDDGVYNNGLYRGDFGGGHFRSGGQYSHHGGWSRGGGRRR